MIQRRRLAAGAIVSVAAVVVVLLISGGGSGPRPGPPPAEGALRLIPAGALAEAHVSTDRSRPGTERALALLSRFPSAGRVRAALVGRLALGRSGLDFDRDVRPWLGREAAVALLGTPGAAAGSLTVLDVADRSRARAFLARLGTSGTSRYRGTPIATRGAAAAGFVSHYLVLGQFDGVRAAIDAAAGRTPSLGRSPAYRRAAGGLPDARFADAYASPAGVRTLLAPRGGLAGAAGVLLDRPDLVGVAVALTATGPGARIEVRSALDPASAGRRGGPQLFAPTLAAGVPASAVAYLGLTHIDRSAALLLRAAAAATAAGKRLDQALTRARVDLARRAGVSLGRDLLPLFRGEVALWLAPALPTPTLTVIARTPDEGAARQALAELQLPLSQLFAPQGLGPGQAPTFSERSLAGVPAFTLRLGPGTELDYAVFDGRVVISTSLVGIRAARQRRGSIADAAGFRATLGDRPKRLSSLGYLDFNQLLRLGERTGLAQGPAYQAIRRDLGRVRAIGAVTSGGETESTAEINLSIP